MLASKEAKRALQISDLQVFSEIESKSLIPNENLPFNFLLLSTKSNDGSNRTQDLLSDGSCFAVSRQLLLRQSGL